MTDPKMAAEIILTVCYLASIAGQALLARKSRLGFVLGFVGNLCGVAAGLCLGVKTMILFSGAWAVPNVYGFFTWKS